MVNPGVITLASLNTTERVKFPYRFEIEDNIGEAIHIHYKNIRIDLTTKEFLKLADTIQNVMDAIVDVKEFSCRDFDPVNLVGLSGSLANLKEIQYFNLHLEDIMVDTFDGDGNQIYASIANSRVVKALNGITAENDGHTIQLNYMKQLSAERVSNQERLVYNLEHIRRYGYPTGKELIVVDADNHIWDGQHRAACLYYLYGNIEIPVRRLVFDVTQESIRNQAAKTYGSEYELYLQEKKGKITDKAGLKDRVLRLIGRFIWTTWNKSEYDKAEYFEKISILEKKIEEIGQKL